MEEGENNPNNAEEDGENNLEGEEGENNLNGTGNSDAAGAQTFSMTQQSHPIRNFFSSLFK